jgi:hypothetical protein
MATKMEHLQLELAHFEHFAPRLPGWGHLCRPTVKYLLEMGMIQVSTAFEQAVAHTGGHELISQDHADLRSRSGLYSDAKLSSVRTCWKGSTYSAPVGGFSNKQGALRVQVYERKQNRFYYFVIPHRAYSERGPKSTIEIAFDLSGNPRRNVLARQGSRQNWWRYEVNTFELMCTRFTDPATELAEMTEIAPAQKLFCPPLRDISCYQ